mmetsp:Transcript_14880/g.24721  ORF Transcript_14880/g.24721 Transcript_14880/m.24721 type:complete len:118 (-) Transcript_14880:87-440(-)
MNPDPPEPGEQEGDDELIFNQEEVEANLGSHQMDILNHLDSILEVNMGHGPPGETEDGQFDDAEEEDNQVDDDGGIISMNDGVRSLVLSGANNCQNNRGSDSGNDSDGDGEDDDSLL